MKDLKRRTIVCECGLVMDRDENAALNIYRYGEELRNRLLAESDKTTDVEIGDHEKIMGSSQVLVEEASTIKPLEKAHALSKV
jgi:transposase